MATDTTRDDAEPDGPDFDVWIHLDSGYDLAYDDFEARLSPSGAKLYLALAELLVDFNLRLLSNLSDDAVTTRLRKIFPNHDPSKYSASTPELLQSLFQLYQLGKDRWLRHAVELRLAARIPDFKEAANRFKLLAPRFAEREIPERARPYLQEVVATFIFGFDPACIALTRSSFEQVAKSLLIERTVFTEGQLRRDQPKAMTLLEKLKQSGPLTTYDAAKRLIDRGNTVLHRHMYDGKILRQQAQDAIGDLASVLNELLP